MLVPKASRYGASVFTIRSSEQARDPSGLGVLVNLVPSLGVRALVFSNDVLPLPNPEALQAAVFEFVLPEVGQQIHLRLKAEDVAQTSTSPENDLGATIVELKSDFATNLEQRGCSFLPVNKSVAGEQRVVVVRLNVGSMGNCVRVVEQTLLRRVAPVLLQYYLTSGPAITGKGAPVFSTASAAAGDAVLGVERFQGKAERPGPGVSQPHFATSMVAIAEYYAAIKQGFPAPSSVQTFQPNRSVCAVYHPDGQGTGALYDLSGAGDVALVTSHRVLPIHDRKQVFGIELAFDEAALGRQLLTPEWVEYVWTDEKLDATALLLSRLGAHVLDERGARPLQLLPAPTPEATLPEGQLPPSLAGEAVRIVHFPNGLRDSRAATVDSVDGVEGGLITYHLQDEDVQKAVSSGAPLVDAQGRAVGMHKEQKDIDMNATSTSTVNVAVKLCDVVSAINTAYESRDVVTAPTYQVPVPFAGESPYKQPLLFAARAGDASATGATSTDGGAAKMRGHAGGRAARKTSARPTSLTAKGRSLSLLAGPWTRKSSIEDQARELRQLPGPWARPSFIARQARALQFLRGPWSRPSTVAEMANKLKEQQGPWSRKASIGLQAHALGNLPGPWSKQSAADWSAVARPTSGGYKSKQALAGALAGAPPPYIHSLWWSSVELLWRTVMGAVCRIECSGLQGSGALYDLPVPGSVPTEDGPAEANLSAMALITSAHVLPLATMLPVPRENGTMMTSVDTLPKIDLVFQAPGLQAVRLLPYWVELVISLKPQGVDATIVVLNDAGKRYFRGKQAKFLSVDTAQERERAAMLMYVHGGPVFGQTVVERIGAQHVHYRMSTGPGSAGAPLLDWRARALGLHTEVNAARAGAHEAEGAATAKASVGSLKHKAIKLTALVNQFWKVYEPHYEKLYPSRPKINWDATPRDEVEGHVEPPKTAPTVQGSRKKDRPEMRARTVVDKNSDGPVEISDVAPDGRCVSLHNKGQATEQVGGWRLVRDLDKGRLVFTWSLPPRFDLTPGQTLRVWSKNARPREAPAASVDDIECDKPSWGLGATTWTTLHDTTGAQRASYQTNTIYEGLVAAPTKVEPEPTPQLESEVPMPIVAPKIEAGPVSDSTEKHAAFKERSEMRARTAVDKSSVGLVAISEISPDSRCVSITNSDSVAQSLGGWRLHRDVENGRLMFDWDLPADAVVNAGQTIKIWAKNFRPTASDPSDLEFDRPSWGLGRETLTSLHDPSGTQHAIYKTDTVFD